MMKLYQFIANRLQAIENCRSHDDNRPHWDSMESKHADTIESACREHLPHGSGFDSGSFLLPESTPEKLVFRADFHHMDEHGFYDGWTCHNVVIRPSLAFGFVLRVTGRDRNGIKDYISDVFRSALSELIPE